MKGANPFFVPEISDGTPEDGKMNSENGYWEVHLVKSADTAAADLTTQWTAKLLNQPGFRKRFLRKRTGYGAYPSKPRFDAQTNM